MYKWNLFYTYYFMIILIAYNAILDCNIITCTHIYRHWHIIHALYKQ